MPDPEHVLEHQAWKRPAARQLALAMVTLCAPAGVLLRPVWAAQVAYAALTGRMTRRG